MGKLVSFGITLAVTLVAVVLMYLDDVTFGSPVAVIGSVWRSARVRSEYKKANMLCDDEDDFQRAELPPVTHPKASHTFITYDTFIPKRQYSPYVGVRVYTPVPANWGKSSFPLVIYLHAGGYVAGSALNADSDRVGQNLASRGFVVTMIDYRKAPEEKFPAAANDVNAAVQWLLGGGLGPVVDKNNVILLGDEVGAQLAAVVAAKQRDRYLRLRDEEAKKMPARIKTLFLLDPTFEMGKFENTPSRVANAESFALDNTTAAWMFDQYFPRKNRDKILSKDEKAMLLDPRFSRRGLKSLPRTHIITCGKSIFADEGIRFAKELDEARVSVVHEHIDKCYSGFLHTPFTKAVEKFYDSFAANYRDI